MTIEPEHIDETQNEKPRFLQSNTDIPTIPKQKVAFESGNTDTLQKRQNENPEHENRKSPPKKSKQNKRAPTNQQWRSYRKRRQHLMQVACVPPRSIIAQSAVLMYLLGVS